MEKINRILEEYDEDYELYYDFTLKLENLIKVLLKDSNIKINSISSRVKDRDSLKKKIEGSTGKYSTLSDITDISGIRIITYFEDEVDKVANIINKEFCIDVENSIDKRVLIDPDRFGYLSLHYVIELEEPRVILTEYNNFKNIRAEIQIRSILQHTWAEIEHDLGYKTKKSVPKDIRRNFSRLAGLLEIADLEFIRTRDNLLQYEEKVEKNINSIPSKILIDKASLRSFINNNGTVTKLDNLIANLYDSTIIFNDKYIERLVEKITFFDIRTISELKQVLEKNENILLEFAKHFMRKDKYEYFSNGISIFYLCYVLAGDTELKKVYNYLTKNGIGDFTERKQIAKRIIELSTELVS